MIETGKMIKTIPPTPEQVRILFQSFASLHPNLKQTREFMLHCDEDLAKLHIIIYLHQVCKQRPSSSKNRRPTEPEEYEHQTDELEAEALYVDPDECMSVYMKIPHLK